MAHRSQLAGFIIDCRTDDLDEAAAFWSQALGMKAETDPDPEESAYRRLKNHPGDVHVEVQAVEHESRVHIDIETDDLEAEVRRLETLGARRMEMIERWWVMEAPGGHVFCVVPIQSDDFPADANQWE